MSDFRVGDDVIWDYQPPGGYGYVVALPAKVCGFTEKRVHILVKQHDGSEKRVTIKRANLRPRT